MAHHVAQNFIQQLLQMGYLPSLRLSHASLPLLYNFGPLGPLALFSDASSYPSKLTTEVAWIALADAKPGCRNSAMLRR